MKLRLYHHHDGARVAYREAGTGPPLALLHSALLTHREYEPLVEELSDRFRLVLPDLPLHGDSEDRPRHPYSPDWMAEVTTIEGLDAQRLKQAFHEHHALQCGFCTAGFLMTLDAYLREHPDPTEEEVKEALAGNLCRCTGYAPIIDAVLER